MPLQNSFIHGKDKIMAYDFIDSMRLRSHKHITKNAPIQVHKLSTLFLCMHAYI